MKKYIKIVDYDELKDYHYKTIIHHYKEENTKKYNKPYLIFPNIKQLFPNIKQLKITLPSIKSFF